MSDAANKYYEHEAVRLGAYPTRRHKAAFQPFFERGNPTNFNMSGNYSVTPGIFEVTSAMVEAQNAVEFVIWNIQLWIEQTTGSFRVDNYGHQAGLTTGWQTKYFLDGKDDTIFSPFVKSNSEIELGFPNGAGGEISYAGGGNKVAKYWVDYNYLGAPIRIRARRNDSFQFVHNDDYGVTMVNHVATAMGYFVREDFTTPV